MDKIEELQKKLMEMKNLTLDSSKTVESMPQPKAPRKSSNAQKPIQAAKAGQQESKKDPMKVAEQLKDAGNKKQTKDSIKSGADKLLKFNQYGQWHLPE